MGVLPTAEAEHVVVPAVPVAGMPLISRGSGVTGAQEQGDVAGERLGEQGVGNQIVEGSQEGRLPEVEQVLQIRLLDVGQQSRVNREPLHIGDVILRVGHRQTAVHPLVVVQRQPQLAQVVLALGAAGRLTRLLNRRQQQRHQNADDGNDHQQFDESKTRRSPSRARRRFSRDVPRSRPRARSTANNTPRQLTHNHFPDRDPDRRGPAEDEKWLALHTSKLRNGFDHGQVIRPSTVQGSKFPVDRQSTCSGTESTETAPWPAGGRTSGATLTNRDAFGRIAAAGA